MFSLLFTISVLNLAFVSIITVRYAYNALTLAGSAAGSIILLATTAFLWVCRKQLNRAESSSSPGISVLLGVILGLLWAVEIGVNNFMTPPLPARDLIDNVFWAVIALAIFTVVIFEAYRTGSFARGVHAGAWSGFVSGLLACFTALSLIVFGMRFILQDPLNAAEWAGVEASSPAPSMAAYFAYETLAGAFLHLLVLGLAMGGLLGLVGGLIGKTARLAGHRFKKV